VTSNPKGERPLLRRLMLKLRRVVANKIEHRREELMRAAVLYRTTQSRVFEEAMRRASLLQHHWWLFVL
jgi:hypothetical protein